MSDTPSVLSSTCPPSSQVSLSLTKNLSSHVSLDRPALAPLNANAPLTPLSPSGKKRTSAFSSASKQSVGSGNSTKSQSQSGSGSGSGSGSSSDNHNDKHRTQKMQTKLTDAHITSSRKKPRASSIQVFVDPELRQNTDETITINTSEEMEHTQGNKENTTESVEQLQCNEQPVDLYPTHTDPTSSSSSSSQAVVESLPPLDSMFEHVIAKYIHLVSSSQIDRAYAAQLKETMTIMEEKNLALVQENQELKTRVEALTQQISNSQTSTSSSSTAPSITSSSSSTSAQTHPSIDLPTDIPLPSTSHLVTPIASVLQRQHVEYAQELEKELSWWKERYYSSCSHLSETITQLQDDKMSLLDQQDLEMKEFIQVMQQLQAAQQDERNQTENALREEIRQLKQKMEKNQP